MDLHGRRSTRILRRIGLTTKHTEAEKGSAVHLVVLAGVAVVFLLVQARYLRPPIISDQLDYFNAAFHLPDTSPSHRHLRIGLLLPVRLGIALFDYSEAAYYFVPILSGLGFLLATYFLGRVLFGPWVGVAASSVAVFNPLFLTDSSELLPDLPAAACFTGALASIIWAGELFRTQRGRPHLWLIAAGSLLGWAYLIRGPLVVALFPLVALVLMVVGIPGRSLIWLAGPALGLLGVEFLWGALVYGDPFIRILAVLGREPPPAALEARQQARAQPNFVGSTMLAFPRILLSDTTGFVPLSFVALLTGGWAWTRDRGFGLLLLWVFAVFVTLTGIRLMGDPGGVAGLRITIPRYWFPIYPPLIVGGTAVMGLVLARLAGRQILSAFMVVTLLLVGFGLWDVERMRERAFPAPSRYDQFRQWLQSHGDDTNTIWTDELTSRLIPAFTRTTFGHSLWDGEIKSVHQEDGTTPMTEIGPGLLLVHDRGVEQWDQAHAIPVYLREPPSHWILLWSSEDGEMAVYDTRSEQSAHCCRNAHPGTKRS